MKFNHNLKMMFLTVLCVISLSITNIQAQPQDPTTYMNGDYYTETYNRPIQAIRYLDKNNRPISTYYTLLNPPLSSDGARQLLSLPPDNNAISYQMVEIPPNLKVYTGQVAEGYWIKEIGQSNWVFKSIQDIDNKTINQIRQNGGEAQYRTGGSVQIEIDQKDISLIKPIGKVQDMPRSNYGTLQRGNTKINISSSTSQTQIQSVIDKFGKFPGGILFSTEGIIKDQITSVKYDHGRNEFLINNVYIYSPKLDIDEIAEIFHVLYNTPKHTLAALNQMEFVGIPEDSKIALTLSEADILLGQIAYGYDVKGDALKETEQISGYRNPLQQTLNYFKNKDINSISRVAMITLSGVEPRFFLEFKSASFQIDKKSKTFLPTEVKIDVFYQTFRYDSNGVLIFTEKEPEYYEPGIINAVHHFKDNFVRYETAYPILIKIRKIAELYAFFQYLYKNNISITDSDYFKNIYQNRIKFPVFYDFYTHGRENSDLGKFYQEVVKLLEKFKINELSINDKFSIYVLLTIYSLNSNQLDKVRDYRDKALLVMEKVLTKDKKSPYFKVNLGEATYLLNFVIPNYVYNQINMSFKYKDTNKKLATYFHNQAVNWLEEAIKEGHQNYHERIADVYHDFGEFDQAKHHRDGTWEGWLSDGGRGKGTYTNGKVEGKWTYWYANGNKKTEGEFKNDRKEGLWKEWYEDGGSAEGTFLNGKAEGTWTFGDANGKKISQGMLKDGQRDGLWKEWYEDGTSGEGTYLNGKLEGSWTFWDVNGKKKSQGTLKNGQKDGVWQEWFENGSYGEGSYIKGNYIKGKAEGKWDIYDKNGTFIKSVNFLHGEIAK